MKHLAIPSLAVAGMLALMTGCNSTKTVTATPGSTAAAPAATASDAGIIKALTGDWAVLDLGGTQVRTNPGEEAPYMGFQPNATNPNVVDFYAFNGCNYINGAFSINGGKVAKAGENASTMKMCADAPYEMAFSTALENIKAFKIQRINNESFLYIINPSGNTVMTLRKHNLNFLEGAWRVEKIDGQSIPASKNLAVVIDLQSKTIHGNAGCNVLNGNIDIDMERENGILFRQLATTRMTCPDIALEQSFLTTLGEVRSAVPGSGENSALLRNAGNQTVILLKRMTKDELRSLDL